MHMVSNNNTIISALTISRISMHMESNKVVLYGTIGLYSSSVKKHHFKHQELNCPLIIGLTKNCSCPSHILSNFYNLV